MVNIFGSIHILENTVLALFVLHRGQSGTTPNSTPFYPQGTAADPLHLYICKCLVDKELETGNQNSPDPKRYPVISIWFTSLIALNCGVNRK